MTSTSIGTHLDTDTETGTDESVAIAHDDLLAALAASDAAALHALVAEDCVIVGPKGYLIDRAEWIAPPDGHVFEQVSLESLESNTRAHRESAVRIDLQPSECNFQGE